MAFRDPLEAAHARIEAVEAELQRLREDEGTELASLRQRLADSERARLLAESDLAIARNEASAHRAIREHEAQRLLATMAHEHQIELTRLRAEHDTQREADREEIAVLRARCHALEEHLAHLEDGLDSARDDGPLR